MQKEFDSQLEAFQIISNEKDALEAQIIEVKNQLEEATKVLSLIIGRADISSFFLFLISFMYEHVSYFIS